MQVCNPSCVLADSYEQQTKNIGCQRSLHILQYVHDNQLYLHYAVGPLDMVNVSFEQESYTVRDGDGSVEICFTTNTGHTEAIEVEVLPMEKPGIPDDMKATG